MTTADPLAAGAGRDAEAEAWAALTAAARLARGPRPPEAGRAYGLDAADALTPVPAGSPRGLLVWQPPAGWVVAGGVPAAVGALLELYLPVAGASARAPLCVGHLGQSLDGFVATSTGDSDYVTGPANITHLHRMRALCDAVLVGAETVASDDPQLTTRHVAGGNPVRVILDPQRRLSAERGVFTDHDAPTLLVCDRARAADPSERVGHADVLGVPLGAGGLDLRALLDALRARGLHAVFVEGGGKTVSAFLEQGLLDRLQIAIAPLITGAGRPGIRLPAREQIRDCLRVAHRVYAMGEDILFDCDLRAQPGASAPSVELIRIL